MRRVLMLRRAMRIGCSFIVPIVAIISIVIVRVIVLWLTVFIVIPIVVIVTIPMLFILKPLLGLFTG